MANNVDKELAIIQSQVNEVENIKEVLLTNLRWIGMMIEGNNPSMLYHDKLKAIAIYAHQHAVELV